MKTPFTVVVSVVVLAITLVGCDAVGSEETAVLNADSPEPPIVEYDFDYSSENVSNNQVTVVSENADNLGSVLTKNGFSRENVVSARVDSLTLRRQSSKTSQPKVFDYLSGAEVFLGTDSNGKKIADDEFSTTQQTISLQVASANVTQEVQGGSTKAFLRLDLSGDMPERDLVEVKVYYRIKVEL